MSKKRDYKNRRALRRRRIKLGFQERGCRLRPAYNLPADPVAALLAKINERLPDEGRERGRGSKAEANHQRLQRCVLANLLYGAFFEEPIRYSRQNGGWKKRHSWMPSHGPKDEVDRWLDAGFLIEKRGWWSESGGEETEINATDELLALAKAHEISISDVFETREDCPLLKINLTVEGEKVCFEFDPRDERYAAEIEECSNLNEFFSKFKITAANNDLTFNMNCVSVCRVFNDADFKTGGRYFGPTYQRLKSKFRKFIEIDGESTEELDYSACFGRMIYHRTNKDYEGDPYNVPDAMRELQLNGLSPENARTIIKLAFQLMVNCRDKNEAIRALKESDEAMKFHIDKWELCKTVLKHIFEFHREVQEQFYNRIGLKLMHIESEIAREIMLEGMNDNICVLCIHDSFIVQSKHKDWLRDQMNNKYMGKLGYMPRIK